MWIDEGGRSVRNKMMYSVYDGNKMMEHLLPIVTVGSVMWEPTHNGYLDSTTRSLCNLLQFLYSIPPHIRTVAAIRKRCCGRWMENREMKNRNVNTLFGEGIRCTCNAHSEWKKTFPFPMSNAKLVGKVYLCDRLTEVRRWIEQKRCSVVIEWWPNARWSIENTRDAMPMNKVEK